MIYLNAKMPNVTYFLCSLQVAPGYLVITSGYLVVTSGDLIAITGYILVLFVTSAYLFYQQQFDVT